MGLDAIHFAAQFTSGEVTFLKNLADASWTDGQLAIGNTSTGGVSIATLTAGSGIAITNGHGTISIAASGGTNAPFSDNVAIVKNNADNTKLVILSAASVSASTTRTLTVQDANYTLIGRDTTDTLTNKTYDTAGTGNSFSINSVAVTANTGTGAVARASSPTFVTPVLGAATATSVNGLIITTTAGTLTVANSASASLITSGNFALTLTSTATTNSTFPAGTHTLAGLDVIQSWSANQTFGSGNLISSAQVINGTVTGTGASATPTASILAMWDASLNLSANNLIDGFTTTATAAGTTVMTITSTGLQVWTGSTTQIVKLPTTSVVAGGQYTIVNQSSGAVTVQSSGANTITILAASTSATFTAVVATPTTAANWNSQYFGVIVTSAKSLSVSNTLTLAGTDGKSLTLTNSLTVTTNDGTLAFGAASKTLTVNNSLTLAGTDSTTMTFPSTTATIARTDAGQTFTGVNVFTSPKIITQVSDTNGNILINIGATASAVNYVKVTNAATGTAGPILAADGETNVDLKIAAKGTGAVHFTTGTYGDLTADSDGSTVTFDLSVSNLHTVTLGGNRTLALSNGKAGQVFTLVLLQDGTGSRTVTWFSNIKWAGGSAPTLTTTASKADVLTFVSYDSTHYYGTVAGQNF